MYTLTFDKKQYASIKYALQFAHAHVFYHYHYPPTFEVRDLDDGEDIAVDITYHNPDVDAQLNCNQAHEVTDLLSAFLSGYLLAQE